MIYSTDDVHPRERLSYWREVATRGYVEHDTIPLDRASFSGAVRIKSLPGVGVSAFQADAHRVLRSERDTAREDSGDLLLSALYAGEIAIMQDGRESVLSGSGLYLVDPIRPFELTLRQRSRHVVLKVPRASLEARIGQPAEFTGRTISKSGGLAALTLGFMELLPDQAERLDDAAGMRVAEQVLDLAALTYSSCQLRGASLSSPRATALLRLKATVERLLTEPGLKPEQVAAETGISVRYANSLLAEEGQSIERYIGDRRLERCRAALEESSQSHRSIGEIAFKWGFSDLSHFGRRFKARFGLTPTDYRRQAEQAAQSAAQR